MLITSGVAAAAHSVVVVPNGSRRGSGHGRALEPLRMDAASTISTCTGSGLIVIR